MKKVWYESWTFWGVVLLAVEAGLVTAGKSYPSIDPYVVALGTFLTAFGFRKAMK